MPCASCCARAGDTSLPLQKRAERCFRLKRNCHDECSFIVRPNRASDRLRGRHGRWPTFVQNGGAQRPSRRPPGRAAVRHDAQWVLRGGRVVLCRTGRTMGLDIKFHAVVAGLCLRRAGLRGDAVAWCGRLRGADLGETCPRYCFDLLRPLVCRRISPMPDEYVWVVIAAYNEA